MNKVYKNDALLSCAFSDEGIAFAGGEHEIFLPYGCIDRISISLLGVLQVTSHTRICTFSIDRKQIGEMKETIKEAKELIKNAPYAEPVITDLSQKAEESSLSPEEQLKMYKEQFIQGKITKEEYDARKRQLK